MDGIEEQMHDEMFIRSIDRKESIYRFLRFKLNIPEQSTRDDKLAVNMLHQLLREKNPIANEIMQEILIYLNEWDNNEEVRFGKNTSSNEINIKADNTQGINNDVNGISNNVNAIGNNPNAIENNVNVISNNVSNKYYNRSTAKQYIDTYWKSYNPQYPSFSSGGGDCANFVSQVLYAGGMPWRDNNKDNYTWYTNWYCRQGATNKDGDKRISLSWKLAAAFKGFWIKHCEKVLMCSYSTIIENIDYIAENVYIGDAVQFCYSNGIPWHTLVITGFTKDQDTNKNDIVLSSHTIDSNSRSLLKTLIKYPGDYKLRIYIIKDGE